MLRPDVRFPEGVTVPLDLLLAPPAQDEYDEEPTLDSLDIILFRGRGPMARLIELFTWCSYSHIGILLRLSDGELYILESVGHTDALQCVFRGSPHCLAAHSVNADRPRVRLVSLRARLRQYCDDAPAWAPNLVDVCIVKTMCFDPYTRDEAADVLYEFARRVCGHAYDSNPVHLLRDSYPSLLGGPATARIDQYVEYTCSQLVAAALLECRILDATLPIHLIQTPRQFIDGSISNHYALNGKLSDMNLHLTVVPALRPQDQDGFYQ
jgi:hypothetical protein